MFHNIYAANMLWLSIMFIIIMALWIFISYLFEKKNKYRIWIFINLALMIFLFCTILYYGVFRRQRGDTSYISFNPFDLFIRTKEQPEYYRSMFMNVILFIPFTLTLSFEFNMKSSIKSLILVTLIGLAVSVGVEVCQYVLKCGSTEMADVMCNTLGALIGGIPYVIFNGIRKRQKSN